MAPFFWPPASGMEKGGRRKRIEGKVAWEVRSSQIQVVGEE